MREMRLFAGLNTWHRHNSAAVKTNYQGVVTRALLNDPHSGTSDQVQTALLFKRRRQTGRTVHPCNAFGREVLYCLLFAMWLLPSLRGFPAVAPGSELKPLYIGNREPLAPSPFMKLPIGSITPQGWLRHQLELEAQGMIGRLPEISKWCKFDGNAWAATDGQGHSGWEELPYWLKGFGDLGYVLKDEKIMSEARKWIDRVLASQEPDGWFGPRSLKTGLEGKPDLWPHMVMLNVLQSFHEYSGDERVIPFLLKYHQWLNGRPGADFGNGYWPKIRFGDNVETAYWLYNRTGEVWLLDLAKKIHRNMADWSRD